MILEIEDETRDFVTIYKKDFPARTVRRATAFKPIPNYAPPLNILNGPYMTYLRTRRGNTFSPSDEQTEDAQEYLNRVRKCPKLMKVLPEVVPNENLIEQRLKETTATTYHLSYSRDSEFFKRKKKCTMLPENWIVSETIQRKSYKNPWKMGMENLIRVKRFDKPGDNLKPNLKEREILRVRTGNSEYESMINTTGNKIVQRNISKKSPLPEQPKENAKNDETKINCSEILASQNIVLPSKVF